jgi:hypothetical protein
MIAHVWEIIWSLTGGLLLALFRTAAIFVAGVAVALSATLFWWRKKTARLSAKDLAAKP